jgi:hypothetical protein
MATCIASSTHTLEKRFGEPLVANNIAYELAKKLLEVFLNPLGLTRASIPPLLLGGVTSIWNE